MWRWSSLKLQVGDTLCVFSTYVEVIPLRLCFIHVKCSILHVCGGDPKGIKASHNFFKYSPRMWRWSLYVSRSNDRNSVFSTYVEVILTLALACLVFVSILHVCGGDPNFTAQVINSNKYSPRMWRWSLYWSLEMTSHWVFSTYVEVIPIISPLITLFHSILHVCGGDPRLVKMLV